MVTMLAFAAMAFASQPTAPSLPDRYVAYSDAERQHACGSIVGLIALKDYQALPAAQRLAAIPAESSPETIKVLHALSTAVLVRERATALSVEQKTGVRQFAGEVVKTRAPSTERIVRECGRLTTQLLNSANEAEMKMAVATAFVLLQKQGTVSLHHRLNAQPEGVRLLACSDIIGEIAKNEYLEFAKDTQGLPTDLGTKRVETSLGATAASALALRRANALTLDEVFEAESLADKVLAGKETAVINVCTALVRQVAETASKHEKQHAFEAAAYRLQSYRRNTNGRSSGSS